MSILPVATQAQEFTFSDCVRMAQEKNPALLAAKSESIAAELAIEQAYSNFYPQLSASIGYSLGNGFGTNGDDAAGTFSPSLNLKQNLFAGRADEERIKQARATYNSKLASLQTLQSKLSFDLKLAFSELLKAQELLTVNQSIWAQRETSHKLVSLLFDSGRENLGSVRLAKANLTQAQFAVTRSEEAILSASQKLAKVLGVTPTSSLKAKGDIQVASLLENPDFDKLSKQVPTYLKALADEEIANSQAGLAQTRFFPNLDLTASVSRSESYQAVNTRWMTGLTLSYSIFNGGEDYYAHKRARELKTAAMLNARSVLQEAAANIASAYYSYKGAREQLDVDNAFLEALFTQERIARENYNNGRLTFQNWDLIATSYVQRQQAIVLSRQNLIAQGAALENALGEGVIK